MIQMYADGACSNNQNKINIGGWGVYIIFLDNNKEVKLNGYEKNTTNNKMELMSCIIGLKYLISNKIDLNSPIEVIMDSQYVISGINTWITSWIKNDWKTYDRKFVKNKDLWIILLELKNKFKNIKFIKCVGHSNNKGNEIADKLAVMAMNKRK